MNLSKTVYQFFNGLQDLARGDVGLEIEVEGENLLMKAPEGWIVHEENSLRGESAEYVLRHPVKKDKVEEYLNKLSSALVENKSILKFSNRTSVHVHINVQDLTITQLYNFITLYIILEDLLVRFSGEERVGNLFCLRVKDAFGTIKALKESIEKDLWMQYFERDQIRYSSINLNAIYKFGSLEFRSLRGTMEVDLISKWVNTLYNLKEQAINYENPKSILQEFSGIGPQKFVEKHLSEEFYKGLPNLTDTLYECARFVQDYVYETDWITPEMSSVFEEARERIRNKFNRGGVVAIQNIWQVGGGDAGIQAAMRPIVQPINVAANNQWQIVNPGE